MSDSNGGVPPRAGFLRGRWDPTVRTGLEQMVVGERGIATFDFDDTVLDGDLSLALLDDLNRSAPRDLMAEYEADCEADTRSGYARLVETLIAGRTEPEVRTHAQRVLTEAFASGKLRIRPELRELIWALQRHRWDVWVVTASPAVVISVAAQQVGIAADRVLGMWCRVGSDGRFTGPTQEPVTYRQGKVEAILSATGGQTPHFAAGDALTDLEMLQTARYALVVDRGNPTLRAEAATRGWWVQGGL